MTLNLKCPNPACGKPFTPEAQQPNIANFKGCTVITIEHDGEYMCDCGTVMVPAVHSLPQITFTSAVVPPEAVTKLIQPARKLIT